MHVVRYLETAMKNIDLGQSISTLANLGVIAGIVFLAVEVQQNTESLETTIRFNQNERQTEIFEELFRNPHLATAVTKAVNEEDLSREEDLAVSALAMRVFQSWAWQFDEFQRGNVSALPAERWRQVAHQYVIGGSDYPLFARYWERARRTVSPQFREWMEDNVIGPGPPE